MSEQDELAQLRAENERLRRELADLEGLRRLVEPITDQAFKFLHKLEESKLKGPPTAEQHERELAEVMLSQLDGYQGSPEGRLKLFIAAMQWARTEALTDAAQDVTDLVRGLARSDADERHKAGARDMAWDVELALFNRIPLQDLKDRLIASAREERNRRQ